MAKKERAKEKQKDIVKDGMIGTKLKEMVKDGKIGTEEKDGPKLKVKVYSLCMTVMKKSKTAHQDEKTMTRKR